jgi:TRAP-type mannitol/chloroaromatic compound transport system substrate-binding protein
LKLRYPGLGGEVLRRMGVVPVTIAATDIVPALRSGQLDGAEWISPWNDMQLGLHEVCNYYYVPGIHEPGHTMELLINPDVWAKLSPLQQDIVQTASWLEYSEALGQFNHENARSLDELRKLKNVEVLRWPNDVIRTFRKLAPEVIRDAVQGDALASEIYKSYASYLQSQLRWAELADRAYWQARYI